MEPISVVWIDSSGNGSWVYGEEIGSLDPCMCISVGFLVKKTKKKIVIVQSLGETDGVNATIAIPVSTIICKGKVKLPKCVLKKIEKFHKI